MSDMTMRHDPTNYSSRLGCWVTCTCGWRSVTWTTITAAHANFGRHLVREAAECRACRTCHGCLSGVHSCCFPVPCVETGQRHDCNCQICEQRRNA